MIRRLTCILCIIIAFCFCSFIRAESTPAAKFDPTTSYDVQQIQGWKIFVNKTFREKEPALCKQTLELLDHQLYQIPRVVPGPAVEKLRFVHETICAGEPCMCYHSGPGWVTDHGMNPEKGNCVELANARNFLTWTKQQPWMVLHELSHAYHDQFLPGGFENADIKAAYERAVIKEKKYDAIQRINGHTEKAYAATNPQLRGMHRIVLRHKRLLPVRGGRAENA